MGATGSYRCMRDLRTAWQVCAIEKVLVLFALNRSNIHTTCPRVSVVPVSRTCSKKCRCSSCTSQSYTVAEAFSVAFVVLRGNRTFALTLDHKASLRAVL